MSKKIYVGNLSFRTTEDGLYSVFSQFGTVISAQVIRDKFTAQSRGFGFVEMDQDGAADEAIATLNGQMIDGRRVRVNAAEEKPAGFNRERGENRSSFNRGDRPRREGQRGEFREGHSARNSSRSQRDSWDYSY
ncbi:MAG: RNA-binding protein [Treponema sp.]|nr:RNA-binding protein [Treponema sp.]